MPLCGAVLLSSFACRVGTIGRMSFRFATSWWLGSLLGFAVWLFAWLLFGGGTGVPDFLTCLLVIGTWLAWLVAIRIHALKNRRSDGVILATFILAILAVCRYWIPSGTSLMLLELIVGSIGLGLYLVFDYAEPHVEVQTQIAEPELAAA